MIVNTLKFLKKVLIHITSKSCNHIRDYKKSFENVPLNLKLTTLYG